MTMQVPDPSPRPRFPSRWFSPGVLLLGAAGAAFCQQGGPHPGAAGPDLNYRLVEWPTQVRSVAGAPAGPWNFIQAVAVATTAKGNILVLHRGAHPIIEFTPGGTLVRSWGDGLFSEGKVVRVAPEDRKPGQSGYSAVYGPPGCYACGVHSVRVDPEDNIWIVDATGHIVYKMNQAGKVLLRLGRKGVAGIGQDTFNLPTDVALGPSGDIYVSDGYANPRVVKFSRAGKYLLEWGKRGNGPGEFQLPHNLVVDGQGRVYVTDRDNQRVQAFDANGEFLSQWSTETGVSTLLITRDQKIWAGGVLRDLDGKVLGRLPQPGGHGTTLDSAGDVYLAQLTGIVQKFVKE
jgi:outer membrane protein assembly factor BamB